jgi:hypothetical protein
MTNPLIDKYFEIHPEKKPKPKPKVIKAEEFEGEVTREQVDNAFKKWASNYIPVASNLTSPSVATSTTGITKALPAASNTSITKPPTLKSYDLDDLKASFVAVTERVKNGEAQVSSMSMEMDIMNGTKITFEVMLYEP